jgi:hypothetical protein
MKKLNLPRWLFSTAIILATVASCARSTRGANSEGPPYSRADDVAPACPPPSVDTTSWRRVRATIAPVSFLLPPGWTHANCPYPDPSIEVWCGSGPRDVLVIYLDDGPETGHDSTLTPPPGADGRTRIPQRSHSTRYASGCSESIAGQTVMIAAGIPTGISDVPSAWATWRLPGGNYVNITAQGARRVDHERMLVVLRTVRLVGS